MFRRIALILASLGAALAATYLFAVRPLVKHWGVDPAEAQRILPGDDLVSSPQASDTRGLTIAAPPSAVWPWLVQMGYGRGGWYSYDAIDMSRKSVSEIHPEWQSLAIGDVVPTDPRGGFVVKAIDPEKALVLYYDTALMQAQTAAAADPAAESTPVNLRATGKALGTMTPPEFAISWAFVLEPMPDGGTRLIERFRLAGEMTGRAAAVSGTALGMGIFAMARKQMLGIQARAERVARESVVLTSFPTTSGQRPDGPESPEQRGTRPQPDEPEIRVTSKVQDLVEPAKA